MTHAWDEGLAKALAENKYSFSPEVQKKFIQYLHLLQKWNKVFNLTAIEGMDDMIYLHLIDSLSILPFLHGNRLLDVGSGGGLPGIPLAIANPEKHWVLLDKSQKRHVF